MTIRNPVEWGIDAVRGAANGVGALGTTLHRPAAQFETSTPVVRQVDFADLREVLTKGFQDFGAYRTDVIFIGLIYPLAGLVLAQFAFGNGMLPMLFPLVSGFALVGPVAAIGLYEMSRRREQGLEATWAHTLDVARSPNFGAILGLSLILAVIFALWLGVAALIYRYTLGPALPVSVSAFVSDVFTTPAGWAMIVLGVGVGFLFALVVLAISVVSFPMLLDRKVRIGTAVRTSVDVVRANPGPMLAWGFIVACALVLGSLPALLGLIVAMPVLGHATWHLYRRAVG
ncbi:hypothetical protein C5L14_18285 [Labrys okinawensis]|uniref:DUF2189 domain-containing protein n=1 Tax=Labrys okinawensis TaxID=346911 RepID=A0A2S9QA19_9HYPH|nr:DUF2189 domain-containing protein [Labrys okinawensis]PRH86192.1 hypothetical protein C5L14_18285 [Labrys okinawensis]